MKQIKRIAPVMIKIVSHQKRNSKLGGREVIRLEKRQLLKMDCEMKELAKAKRKKRGALKIERRETGILHW